MADYKELLRRAISALPENNGAARRAVYEKARSALVGQLRAITPPLPARDITQHRLQLEDCIRQVEQEASEAVITLGRDQGLMPRQSAPPPRPHTPPAETPPPVPEKVHPVAVEPEAPVVQAPPEPEPVAEAVPVEIPVAVTPAPAVAKAAVPAQDVTSIEDIISQAANNSGASVTPVKSPTSVDHFSGQSRRDGVKAEPTLDQPAISNVRAFDKPLNEPKFEPRLDIRPISATSGGAAVRKPDSSFEPVVSAPQTAEVVALTPTPVDPALSAVREVELETKAPDTSEAEGAIERAIETLDREARGEPTTSSADTAQQEADRAFAVPDYDEQQHASDGDDEIVARRAGSGLTIFLVVFAILLAGAGGTGFWAWREGYVDLDQMFGNAPSVAEAPAIAVDPGTPTMDPVQPPIIVEPNTDVVGTPGNTATATPAEPTQTLEGVEDRLEPSPEPVVATGNEVRLPALGTGDDKSEERLPGEERLPSEDATANSDSLTASVDPAVLAGSQSLLLEASTDGRTGAVPFSGTVDWSEGADELGEPTLIGRANIPARNLGVRLTIRKNSDPSLPASHLMEVDFDVNDTFIGGTIANLPGVLLKNEELVPGTPLVGASARVVGNSFLFALSASPNDTSTNTNLLENRKWMDLAVVYGTGRNAIITLEKDDTAQALFAKVFGAWKT